MDSTRSRRLDHLWRSTAALAVMWVITFVGAATASPSSPGCTTSKLVVWLNTAPGGAAAGSTYVNLELTNLSGHTCTLRGYPGVSAIDLDSRQLGSAAGRNPLHPLKTITLAPGASAVAVLQVADVYNYPAATCHRTMAAGLRVYPPGQTRAKTVPFAFLACSLPGPAYLHVARVQRA